MINYAQPRYEEVDPTFLLALTYPLLFGAMFGDVGQGVLLAILGWLITTRKVKALNSLYSLGGMIAALRAVCHPVWISLRQRLRRRRPPAIDIYPPDG